MALISRRATGVVFVVAALLLVGVTAHSHHAPVEYKAAASIEDMSMAEFEDKLQVCTVSSASPLDDALRFQEMGAD